MKTSIVLLPLLLTTFCYALVHSDQEAKQFFREQGAGHGDFIEAADTLFIESMQIVPKGSHCISLPIKALIQRPQICCFKGTESDSTTNPGFITVWAKNRSLCAVKIKQDLYIGRSFKEIANEILSRKIH